MEAALAVPAFALDGESVFFGFINGGLIPKSSQAETTIAEAPAGRNQKLHGPSQILA
jgi:hypothetical protein